MHDGPRNIGPRTTRYIAGHQVHGSHQWTKGHNVNQGSMPLTTEAEQARMAESVDALVSNTSGAIRAGSIPAPGT